MLKKALKVVVLYVFIYKVTLTRADDNPEYEETASSREYISSQVLQETAMANNQSVHQLKHLQKATMIDYTHDDDNSDEKSTTQEAELIKFSTLKSQQTTTDYEELENTNLSATEPTQEQEVEVSLETSTQISMQGDIEEQYITQTTIWSNSITQNNLYDQGFQQSNSNENTQHYYDESKSNPKSIISPKSEIILKQDETRDLREQINRYKETNPVIGMLKSQPLTSTTTETFYNPSGSQQINFKDEHETMYINPKQGHRHLLKSHNKGKINKSDKGQKRSKAKSRRYRERMTEASEKVVSIEKETETSVIIRDDLSDIVVSEIINNIMKNNSEKLEHSSPSAIVTNKEDGLQKNNERLDIFEKDLEEDEQKMTNVEEARFTINSQENVVKRKHNSKAPQTQMQQFMKYNHESDKNQERKKLYSPQVYDNNGSREHVSDLLNMFGVRVYGNTEKEFPDDDEKRETHSKKIKSYPRVVKQSVSNSLRYFHDLSDEEGRVLSNLTSSKNSPQEQQPNWLRKIRDNYENKDKWPITKETARFHRSSIEQQSSVSSETLRRYDSYESRNNLNKRYSKSGKKALNKNSQEMKEEFINRRKVPLPQRQLLAHQETHEPKESSIYKEMQELFEDTNALFGNIVAFCKSILMHNNKEMTRSEIEKLSTLINLSRKIPIERFAR